MTKEEKQQLYAALGAPFPAEAIERTDGAVTGKGYSTTGIKYQYIANRLNDVLGIGGYRVERSVSVRETQSSKGRPMFEATCELKLQIGEWLEGVFMPFGEAIGDGGHTAATEIDARKGAYTASFKKGAAFFGVGRQAYEGTLEDGVGSSGRTHPVAANAIRLTARQLSAIWAIARQHAVNEQQLLAMCRERYGVEVSLISREQASELIVLLGTTESPAQTYKQSSSR